MASLPANDLGSPPVAGEIILVPVAEVTIGERLRPLDAVWAEALGQVMAREGQRDPIEVCRLPGKAGWHLVSGAHRVTGARAAGMELIEAREVSSSADYRRYREASENLWKRGLDPIGRAAHIAELVRLQKLRSGVDPGKPGRSLAADARWKKAVRAEAEDASVTMTVAYGFSRQVADQLGFSLSLVERDLALYRRLSPYAIGELRRARHPILDNAGQLRALAKLDGELQAQVVDRLTGAVVNGRTITSVAQALELVTGPKASGDPGAKRLSTFIGAYQRMSLAEKKGAAEQLDALLPTGFRIVHGEAAQADREIGDALNAAFDFFQELGKWDADAAIGLVGDQARGAAGKVQLALMRFNAGRRR
jgi:hypothetical protein